MANARRRDPITSWMAANSVANEDTIRYHVVRALNRRPMTDEELLSTLSEKVACTPSGVRSRRAELTQDGYVVNTGRTRKTTTGREAQVWAVNR